jgi:hypothetical protein
MATAENNSKLLNHAASAEPVRIIMAISNLTLPSILFHCLPGKSITNRRRNRALRRLASVTSAGGTGSGRELLRATVKVSLHLTNARHYGCLREQKRMRLGLASHGKGNE